MKIDRGYLSPYFITNADRMEARLTRPLVCLHQGKLSEPMSPLLEAVVQIGRPLFIVAEDIEREALATLVVNRLRGILQVAAIKASGLGRHRKALLQDIAIFTGGQVIGHGSGIGLESAKIDTLGQAGSIVVKKDNTKIIDGAGARTSIDGRLAQLRAEAENTTSEDDKERLQERIANLA